MTGAVLGGVQVSLFVAGAVLGEGQVSLFVAGAALGEPGCDLRHRHRMGISHLHSLCGCHLSILVGTLPGRPGHRGSFVPSTQFPPASHIPSNDQFAGKTGKSSTNFEAAFEAAPTTAILGSRKHG